MKVLKLVEKWTSSHQCCCILLTFPIQAFNWEIWMFSDAELTTKPHLMWPKTRLRMWSCSVVTYQLFPLNIIHVVITSVKTLWAVKQFCRRRRCAVTCSTSCKRPGVTSVETPVSESVPPCEDYYSMSIEAAARSDPRSKPPSRRLSANTLHLQPTSEPRMLPVQKQPEALWAPSQSFNKQSDCVPVEAQTRLQGMFDTRLHRVSKCS